MGEKIVNMNNESSQESKKLSYEELQDIVAELSTKNRQLEEAYKKVYAAYNGRVKEEFYLRMEWLWRVVENANFFNEEFVDSCKEEFMTYMKPAPLVKEDVTKEE